MKADDLFKKQCKADIFLSYTSMIQLGGMEVVGCLTIVVSFVLGSQMVASGEITVGKLIGFYTLCSMAVVRSNNLNNVLFPAPLVPTIAVTFLFGIEQFRSLSTDAV